MRPVSSLSVHFLKWSGINQRLLFHLFFGCFSSFPLSSLSFLLLFMTAASVSSVLQDNAGSSCCVHVCVWHADIPAASGRMFGPPHSAYSGRCSRLCGGLEGVRVCVHACVCVCVNIVDTRLIITQTAMPLVGHECAYFKVRVCVSAP